MDQILTFSSFLFTSFHFYISGKFHRHSSFYAIIYVCMLILCDVKTCKDLPKFFKYLDGIFYTTFWFLRIKGHFVFHRYPSNFWMGSLVFWKYLSFFHKFWQVFAWGKARNLKVLLKVCLHQCFFFFFWVNFRILANPKRAWQIA